MTAPLLNPAARPPSSLLQYLPGIYQEDPFLGRFLSAFEKVLLDREDGVPTAQPGIEHSIAHLAELFDPLRTPDGFLPWLAGWAAFTLRADLDPTLQRRFLAHIMQLYRLRGTKKNLQDLLAIFTVGAPSVVEAATAEFEIGVHSQVGVDTYLGGAAPHFFTVTISLAQVTHAVEMRQRSIATALIELEKPAHTMCRLEVVYPSMRIGVFSTVGVDTLLGASV